MPVKRRDLIYFLAATAAARGAQASLCGRGRGATARLLFGVGASQAHPESSSPAAAGSSADYHGYILQDLTVDGCAGHLVRPMEALPGRPWVWRTMFWDAFPAADIALLKTGFHLAYLDVGNTFGCPDAMKHFDRFYDTMTKQYQLCRQACTRGLEPGRSLCLSLGLRQHR